jgi:hypothetical protein
MRLKSWRVSRNKLLTLCNQETGQALVWDLSNLKKRLRNSTLKIFAVLARFLITTESGNTDAAHRNLPDRL